MKNPAKMHKTVYRELVTGKIKFHQKTCYWVETEAGLFKSKKAGSCLLEPKVSDTVLLFENSQNISFIVAILEKGDAKPSRLQFEGDVDLITRNGNLRIESDGIGLEGNDIAVSSNDLSIKSQRGRISVLELSFLGRILKSHIWKIKSVAATCDVVVERLTQKSKGCYRWIEDLEQTSAGRLTYRVKNTLFMKGHRSRILAEKTIKMDAEKIHLG